MNKSEAIEIFGSVSKLASALGVTRHAIYMWPNELPKATQDRVIGGAVRAGFYEKVAHFKVQGNAA